MPSSDPSLQPNQPHPDYTAMPEHSPSIYTETAYSQQPTSMASPQHDQSQFRDYFIPVNTSFAPQKNGLAIASMVLGIIGLVLAFFFVGIIFSILAVIFGHISVKQVKKSNHVESGRGLAIAGLVMGYLVLVFFATILGIGIITDIITAVYR